nr:hypothetical protein [Tanacetum cinerariifolium]
METTIDQQVALDESLIPSTKRLRIGRSNFRLPSDIQSKESTLQAVYDVLRNSPLFRAFQVTVNVPEIYMQEFWATAKLHHNSIRFKIDTKKSVLDLEAFREMLHISPRIPNQPFADLPTEEEILDFLRNSKAYKEYYACAMGEAAPKPKASARKKKGESASSTNPPTPTPTTTVESAPRLSATAKGKQPSRATTPTEPIDVERTEAEQLKIVLKKSRQETHISQQRGSGTDEGTGSKPGVPDVPSDDSEEELSWKCFDDEDVGSHEEGNKSDESDDDRDKGSDDDSDETVKAGAGKDDDDDDDEDDDDNDEEEELAKDDDEETETGKGGDEVRESEGESEEEEEEETRQEEEESFDLIPRTPDESEEESNDEEAQELRINEEARLQEEEDADELYRDVNINQGRGLQVTQNVEDTHVTLTPVNPDGPQESSYMSSFVSGMLNPINDVGVESIFKTASSSIVSLQTPTPIMTPSTIATITTSDEAPIPPPTIPSMILENLPTDVGVESIFMTASSPIVCLPTPTPIMTPSTISTTTTSTDLSEMELKKILIEKMEGNKFIQRSDEQRNLYKAEDERMMIRKDPPLDQTGGLKDKKKEVSMHQLALHLKQQPRVQADQPQGLNLDNCLPVSLLLQRNLCRLPVRWRNPPHPVFETGADDQPIVQTSQHTEWFSQPKRPPSPDRAWNTTLPAAQGDAQSWISDLARQTEARSSFNELLDTPIDFSNFIMNRLNFYGYAVNRESALDVYSKRRIIAVTELKIVEWHDYKHLDWILVRRDDDKIYKFKEGDLKRLRLQDIEDMLLLLVQGKLSNLTVEEHFAFNVSIIMFTRSIVIKRRVKDLQLGVESYQKRLNLTKPDTYRPDLKRREAYTAHWNPRGFIYQNKDKKNRLMRIDELHKFSDGMLNDARNALDDRLKEIRMQYLPTTIWRRGDKDRATTMIQAIDKMLKTRRIMRSLEKFIGGRL